MKNVLIAVLLFAAPLSAQERIYESNMKYEQGDWITISSTRFVRHIAIGNSYIYFATTGGITRLDSYSYKWDFPWTVSNGMASNNIYLVAEDKNTGYLWAVTDVGLSYLEPASQRWYNLYYDEMGLNNANIGAIGFGNGSVWILTSNNAWYSSDNTVINFWEKDPPQDRSAMTWYGQLEDRKPDLPHFFLPHGYMFNNDQKYIDDMNLRRFNIAYWKRDEWNNMWVATWGLGAARGNLNTMQMELFSLGLWDDTVDAIAKKGETFWVSGMPYDDKPGGVTLWKGLDAKTEYYEPQMITAFYNDAIRSIEVDRSNGSVWFGTQGGVTRYDPGRDSWVTYNSGDRLIDNRVNDIVIDSDAIYVATQEGVSKIIKSTVGTDSVRILHVALESLNLREVYDLALADSILWMGTEYGVYRYDTVQDSGFYFVADDGEFTKQVFAIDVVDDQVWLGTRNGVRAFDARTGVWLQPPLNFKETSGAVNRLNASGPLVWVVTQDGVYKYDKERGYWHRYTRRDGLPTNAVYAVYPDGDYVWFGTEFGLTRFFWNDPSRID